MKKHHAALRRAEQLLRIRFGAGAHSSEPMLTYCREKSEVHLTMAPGARQEKRKTLHIEVRSQITLFLQHGQIPQKNIVEGSGHLLYS